MPGYATREITVHVGDRDYFIRALSDLQQFADPDGDAERMGISSAQWSLFGQLWPAGQALAGVMADFDIAGKRILELGCGLGVPSLVLQGRHADVTASDHHPLAESFLTHNARRNDLPPLAYRDLDWGAIDDTLGRFDLIIGSDLLYERGQARRLARLIANLDKPGTEVIISDPGRGNAARLTRDLREEGYTATDERLAMRSDVGPTGRGRLLRYRRRTS